ncbi:MAG TPA: hypothetical protein VNB90_02240 [Cytophagaceae bacterium]|nr:hypothetical protein [Cytophagaceae bacterium]
MPHIAHLSKDKKFAKVLKNQEKLKITKRKNVFINLVRSIVGQQLSTKAAESIYQKFLLIYDGQAPTEEELIRTPVELLRKAGLSYSKASYLKNIALFWQQHQLSDKHFSKLSDDEIIALLTQIKGVGKWTVQMLLMFSLGREDIFSPDDLGIRKAMCQLYQLDENAKDLKKQMLALSEKWSPYRTYACLYLWKWRDK